MLITPVFLKKKFYKKDFIFKEGPSVQVLNSIDVLEQFNLLDLTKELELLAALVPPNGIINPHIDGRLPNGKSPLWSLLFLAEEDKNSCSVELEIYRPKSTALSVCLDGPIGNKKLIFKHEDCDVIETWNFKIGECYFDPSSNWHGAKNYSNIPQVVFSLRSGTIDIEQVLKRIT